MEDKRGEKDKLHKKHVHVRVSACACICLCMCGEKEGGGCVHLETAGMAY